MPRTFTASVLFPCTFAQAAQAVWHKYPNPYAEHVQSIDVLDRFFCPDTGVLRTERLISVEQPTPRWIQMLLGITGETYVREVITFDPHMPCMQLESTNLSFAEYLQVKEHVVYRPGEGNDPAQVGTRFDQTAHIECCGTHTQSRFHGVFSSAARKVEDASYGRFRDNAALGRLGFASVLAALGGGKQAHYEPVLIEK